VGDSILMNPMLRFAELVLGDDDLKARYEEPAKRYVEVARRDLIEKWDARYTWMEDGPYGAYAAWDRYMEPGDISQWEPIPILKSNLSLPFNKQNDMGIACLRLFRITGETAYRDRAERIFLLMKGRFRLVEDRYIWNYWEPAGSWDIDPENDTLRHWVNVHPYRNYQAGEVHDIAEAYHSGIVFDETDMRRILNTNLKVMWNGDREDPQWRNSNDTGPWAPPPPSDKEGEGRAGALWTGLIDLDETVRDLYECRLKPEGLSHAFYHNVTAKTPPGYQRKYCKEDPGPVPAVPFSECRDLIMGAALPCVIQRGVPAVLASKALQPGDLEVALYTTEGRAARILHKRKAEGANDLPGGITVLRWDGTDPDGKETFEGDYRIRWTMAEGYREFGITVK
jgi:hypothetical protein